ncbi:uncharacterized protein LY89DRAFT_738380 [Mollisia scopiformis]|uniref:Uncharacterized protein n=1 Tax=Mollisia scopiformis TaxID=149040 RepID=A0A194WX98_MOLSC|nr:uncharacterized protein LY89DRAFT_738380 [Mollisia scopiformis]KUJ12606.1 hypothetical protein LY89DRAFT_738380 [Mollisia scopiformis]
MRNLQILLEFIDFSTIVETTGLPNVDFVAVTWNSGQTSCYIIAQFHITVGVVLCQEATVLAESVIECWDSASDIVADLLADYSLTAGAVTISALDGLSVTTAFNYGDDPALHAQNILKLAYQGIWSSMTNFLGGAKSSPTPVNDQVPAIVARVSSWRVGLWIGMNVLLTLASIILLTVQSGCTRDIVEDPVLAPILLDSSEVIGAGHTGLCNLNVLTKEADRQGKLRLRCLNRSVPHWHHDKLELEGESSGHEQ